MRYNRKRHLLLKVLTKKLLNYPKNKGKNTDGELVGLTFDEVDSLLKTDKVERHIILSELIKSNEIIIFNTEKSGVFIEPRIGVSAFADKKYIRINNSRAKNNTKDIVQIMIPVLSLVITVLVLSFKMDGLNSKTTEEIQAIDRKVESIQNIIDKLGVKTEVLPYAGKIDSLSISINEQD